MVRRKANSLVTTVYRKPTYTGLLTKWTSFVPRQYKVSAVSTMIHRGTQLTSTYVLIHEELDFIRSICQRNGYPIGFVENQIRGTLGRYIRKADGAFIAGYWSNN